MSPRQPPGRSPRLPRRLLAWIALGAGIGGVPAMAGIAERTGTEAFSPTHCMGAPPPAELLALADWPLDPGGTCVPPPLLDTDNKAQPAWRAPVVEATVLHPHDVSGLAYGDLDAAPNSSTATATQASPPIPLPATLASAAVIGDDELAGMRGGFETADGLRLSFGIERAVYINGALQSVTSLNVDDLGKLHGNGLAALPPGTTLTVIQNGPGNQFQASGLSPSTLATVVQNSLDNQKIQTVTTLSATVNSMEMLRGARMQNSLQEALTRALVR